MFNVLVAHSQGVAASPPAAEVKSAVDPFGRSNPRGAIQGYLSAISEGDFDKAARYLNLSDVPIADRKATGRELAEQLKQLLDRGGVIDDLVSLSDVPEGTGGDNLEINIDRVGVLDRSLRKVPLLLERVKGENNFNIWLVSQETLKRVPFLLQVSKEGLLDRLLPESFKEKTIGAVSTGHWIAIIVVAFLALVVGYIISWLVIAFLRKVLARRTGIPGYGLLASVVIPLAVVIGVSLYRIAVVTLGVQVIAREYIERIAIIVSWLALAWLLLRIIDGVADVVRYGMSRTNRQTSVAVVMLARRMAKAVVIGITGIAILDNMGIDVSTGLAALGIGGLALALGAQKTIENLVGSISVVADRPVRVGDFCKFGEVTGTVEDIGIRSTQIRTLDRTIVTVPNGAFASMQIENYTMRDDFKFQTVLTMRYETTPDQIRYLLVELRAILYAHERVKNDPARVRFIGLGSHSLDIEIFCYVGAVDYSSFLEVQEDLLLRIMEVVKASGSDFAFPSQTLYFAKDDQLSESQAAKIGKAVRKLDEKGELSIPRFDPEKIAGLDGTIPFPEK
ncbi:MAG: mechanosensitive ion channel family protein [Rhizobiaceae bacterium]